MKSYGLLLALYVLVHLGSANILYKVIAGRTGVGKSYISTHSGCQSESCSGTSACTTDTNVCLNGIIDTIGLDHEKSVTVTDTKGVSFKISGINYPIYSLLEKLESQNISEATFFVVYDANNMKTESYSSQGFVQFVTINLNCKLKRVVNKYRENAHFKKLQGMLSPEDIIIKEGQTQDISLDGPVCQFQIPSNWRDFLLRNDIDGLGIIIKRQKCDTLISRLDELQRKDQSIPPKDIDSNACQYWGETGGRYCKGVKILGKCSNWEPNRGWKTDDDCIRRRNEKNHYAQVKFEERVSLVEALKSGIEKVKNEIDVLHC